ncbi:hypothetical protein [Belnapia sp. F-4-1]|uniref:hypothetical protein n=1 Tax=Belnapia sp. F-4-1 TaxID=1545443 RepID=UPI0005B8418B|nr:hypothetical protein [Belnapia sp. F-4-1]
MPLFGLIPLPVAAEAAEWSASTYRGPCYVMASDERRARLYAASYFARPDAARLDSGLRMESPWVRPRMVALQLAFRQVNRSAPEGTVVVPQARDAIVLRQARKAIVLPQARGTTVLPQASRPAVPPQHCEAKVVSLAEWRALRD